jgi:hypothetical protein
MNMSSRFLGEKSKHKKKSLQMKWVRVCKNLKNHCLIFSFTPFYNGFWKIKVEKLIFILSTLSTFN